MEILNAGYRDKFRVDYALGSCFWADGKRYVDYALCGGTHIFGHAPQFIFDKVLRQMSVGNSYGIPNRVAEDYAREFEKHVNLDSLVFCNSGSEAVMRAFRIAREHTGKKKIAVFEGSWHGSYDGTVGLLHPKGIQPQDVIVLPRDLSFLKEIHLRSDIAMILIEPFQGSCPVADRTFMKKLYDICKVYQILLGFDEIISGFRFPGIDYYGITPDIALYGKIAGGGFPIGIVAGSWRVMRSATRCFMGGTFSGNPMTLAAGSEVLKRLTPDVTRRLNGMGAVLKKKVNEDSPLLSITGHGSFLRLMMTKKPVRNCKERDAAEDKTLRQRVHDTLMTRGIYLGSNGLIFLSTEHTKEQIEFLSEALCLKAYRSRK